MAPKPIPRAQRFWPKVAKVGECWEWQSHRDRNGYGRFSERSAGAVRVSFAHRVAYELSTGERPAAVCHSCDNPACCRPEHLFPGTQADNMEDRMLKGRAAKKLTPEAVLAIRGRRGESQRKLAKEFGVTQPMIGYVQRGEFWGHV